MTRAPLEPRAALLLALSPVPALVLGFAAGDVIPTIAAIAILGLLGAGLLWYFQRQEVEGSAESPVSAPAEWLRPEELLEPMPDPVVLLDRDRRIVTANRAARDLFGIGTTGGHLARSLRHPAVLAAVDTVEAGAAAISEEITLPVPVPRTFTFHAAALPERSEPDSPTVAIVLHDETRARRAEQSRADFVANASHELRSPLSVLIGYIETLRGPARDDAEARERFLEVMRSEALRMARLIEDLLSLSRVEINEHVPPRGRVEVTPLVRRVVESLYGRALDREMNLRIDAEQGLPVVSGEADELTQAVHNLVDNALKYARPRTEITISCTRAGRVPGGPGAGVAISVADRGEGLAAVHLPRITERFYRVDTGRSRKVGGTGLGLAIVKHIVNRHRGHLRIESTPGEGSRFTIILPASGEEPAPAKLPTAGSDVMQT